VTRYRRRPSEVEAFQVTAENIGATASWPEWAQKAAGRSWNEPGAIAPVHGRAALMCATRAGLQFADVGDWILLHPRYGIGAMPGRDFEAAYEEVEEDQITLAVPIPEIELAVARCGGGGRTMPPK
jgi:hypothetical protein